MIREEMNVISKTINTYKKFLNKNELVLKKIDETYIYADKLKYKYEKIGQSKKLICLLYDNPILNIDASYHYMRYDDLKKYMMDMLFPENDDKASDASLILNELFSYKKLIIEYNESLYYIDTKLELISRIYNSKEIIEDLIFNLNL